MDDKVKVGLIGLGRMGRIYVKALTFRIPRAELVAVADINREAAKKIAASYSIKHWFDNYQDLLKMEDIRGVVIAASTSAHTEIIVGAAEAGKDIFCEKPVALTLKETDTALKTVKKAKVKFQSGFMRRFDRGYMSAKKKIEEGKIGKPVSFKSIGRDPMCPRLDYAKVSGGLIMDMAIHDFDLARWLMESEVKRVYAEGGRLVFDQLKEVDDIDNATINMLFSNGSLGNGEVGVVDPLIYQNDHPEEILLLQCPEQGSFQPFLPETARGPPRSPIHLHGQTASHGCLLFQLNQRIPSLLDASPAPGRFPEAGIF